MEGAEEALEVSARNEMVADALQLQDEEISRQEARIRELEHALGLRDQVIALDEKRVADLAQERDRLLQELISEKRSVAWLEKKLEVRSNLPASMMYECRDAMTLEPFYSRHVSAMTTQELHKKSDIAAELAWRDARIAQVVEERDDALNALTLINEEGLKFQEELSGLHTRFSFAVQDLLKKNGPEERLGVLSLIRELQERKP